MKSGAFRLDGAALFLYNEKSENFPKEHFGHSPFTIQEEAMGKKKSVVLLVIYTLLIAVLCFICTVSFSYGTDNLHAFSSVMRMMEKDADLGLAYGANADAGAYLGGGYSAVY